MSLGVTVQSRVIIGQKAMILDLLSPSGGETWAGLSTQTIEWTDHTGTETYVVELSTNGGGAWSTLSTQTRTGYTWTLPNDIASATCIVRVTADDGTTDQSAAFTITIT